MTFLTDVKNLRFAGFDTGTLGMTGTLGAFTSSLLVCTRSTLEGRDSSGEGRGEARGTGDSLRDSGDSIGDSLGDSVGDSTTVSMDGTAGDSTGESLIISRAGGGESGIRVRNIGFDLGAGGCLTEVDRVAGTDATVVVNVDDDLVVLVDDDDRLNVCED